MTTDSDSIIRKVQSLLALAGNNANEQEAALAMEKAQELLAKYNLDMAEIGQRESKPADAPRSKEKVERSAMFKFQRDIWSALADANFCVYWSQAVHTDAGVFRTHHHYLVGRTDNVITIKLMGEYLEGTINRLCPYKTGKDVNRWKEGCASRICERLKDKRRRMEEEDAKRSTSDPGCVSLVVVFRSEQHLNYVFQNGSDAWCPCRDCSDRRNAKWKAEAEEYRLMHPKTETLDENALPEKTETPVQKRKREEKEEREWQRRRNRWDRERRKEEEKTLSEAYLSGRETGERVGIDAQVEGTKERGRIA
jgi:hypothetical protein